MIREYRLPDGAPVKLPGIVPKLSDTPGDTRWIGPDLGAHTAEVLGALGYSAQEQDELKRKGII
jgi:formyl-CoA transferase